MVEWNVAYHSLERQQEERRLAELLDGQRPQREPAGDTLEYLDTEMVQWNVGNVEL